MMAPAPPPPDRGAAKPLVTQGVLPQPTITLAG